MKRRLAIGAAAYFAIGLAIATRAALQDRVAQAAGKQAPVLSASDAPFFVLLATFWPIHIVDVFTGKSKL